MIGNIMLRIAIKLIGRGWVIVSLPHLTELENELRRLRRVVHPQAEFGCERVTRAKPGVNP